MRTEVKRLRVVVDDRERPSGVPDTLSDMGIRVDYSQLEVGDYVLSPDVAVERKELRDLLSSIFDGRLFTQCRDLSSHYSKPVLVVEGDILALRDMTRNPKMVYGALASIILSSNVRLLYTRSIEETATAILLLAQHLSRQPGARPLIQKIRKSVPPGDQQLFMVTSLPGVGAKLAARLLESFKTPRRVFTATAAEMARVHGVGYARAVKIEKALTTPFKPSKGEEGEQATLS